MIYFEVIWKRNRIFFFFCRRSGKVIVFEGRSIRILGDFDLNFCFLYNEYYIIFCRIFIIKEYVEIN